jgi:3'(2'), 5'-bisphosphate nucleotidase
LALEAVRAASRVCTLVQASIERDTLVKKDKSPVTVADYASQAIICRRIKAAFPGDAILAEEHALDLVEGKSPGLSAKLVDLLRAHEAPGANLEDICGWIDAGRSVSGGRTWILDPIDGTKGFLRGEQYAVALALMVDGVLEMGFLGCPNIAYDAERNGCLFAARRGQGAAQHWLGDLSVSRPIRVTDGAGLRFAESVEAEHADHAAHQGLAQAIGAEATPLRMDSQGKYAVVARGDAAIYLRLSPDPKYRQKAWDHAAGCLIVEEAGGRVTDAAGRPLDFTTGAKMDRNLGVVATNGGCHDALLAAIRAIAPHD